MKNERNNLIDFQAALRKVSPQIAKLVDASEAALETRSRPVVEKIQAVGNVLKHIDALMQKEDDMKKRCRFKMLYNSFECDFWNYQKELK
jgi:hypothetical protein